MRTVLPANWVAAGYGVPQVCSRHGEPAVESAKVNLQSRPPGWAYALLALGALPYIIVVYAMRKTVIAPSWPFCAQCKALRTRLLVIGLLGSVGGVAMLCGGAAVSGSDSQGNPLGALLVVLGIFVAIAGVVVAAASGRAALARARVSQDGVLVEILKPERRFAEQVTALFQQPGAAPPYGQQAYAEQPYGYGYPPPQQPYGVQPYGYHPYPPQAPAQQPGAEQYPNGYGHSRTGYPASPASWPPPS